MEKMNALLQADSLSRSISFSRWQLPSLVIMIHLTCRKLLYIRPRASPLTHGKLFSTSSQKPSTKVNNSAHPKSLTVSYLQKSCGLSLESAISASQKLHCDTTRKPNSVLKLLKTHGLTRNDVKDLITKRPLLLVADLENTLKPNLELFQSLGFTGPTLAKMLIRDPRVLETNANAMVECFKANGFSEKQIATMTRKRPHFFLLNAHKVYEPKLEYFKSLGVSELDVAKMLTAIPWILERSLENHIIPCVEFLRRVLCSDENVLRAIRASYRIVEVNIENVLEPNISTLVKHGVPKSMISKLFLLNPKPLVLGTYRFSEVVSEVKRVGFDPTKMLFLLAIRSMGVMSKELWKKKLEAYMSFGLRKDDIYSAFKKQPMCMLVSETKIRKLMGFFVNELSMNPSFICKNPNLLLLSLEKRIAPRCSVLQLLMSKELINGDFSLVNLFRINEKTFLEKFVEKYEHKLPEVVEAYQGNIKFQGFSFKLKM